MLAGAIQHSQMEAAGLTERDDEKDLWLFSVALALLKSCHPKFVVKECWNLYPSILVWKV